MILNEKIKSGTMNFVFIALYVICAAKIRDKCLRIESHLTQLNIVNEIFDKILR
jgi:hypothetical protein